MCRSVRGLMLGCLAFSITYVLCGCIQFVIGVVFMVALPIFRLASNIWTGSLNILLGIVMSSMVCCGQATLTKHRICLGVSVAVVLVNLSNLLILEICEWRAYLPPVRIQNIMREEKTDLLLAAYLSSTISTAVALVVGFVACEYIYCLLIAAAARSGDEVKPEARRRGFSCRNRRASWYEPISFSWVFEASDNFNTSQGSAARGRSLTGVPTKTFHNGNAPITNSPSNTFVVPRTSTCGTSSTIPVSDSMPLCNGTITVALTERKHVVTDGSVPQSTAGRIGADSKSSSGYSSPDWLTQRCNVRNLSEKSSRRYDNHCENVNYYRVEVQQPHFMEEPRKRKGKHHHHHYVRSTSHEREVRSLMQLPIHHEVYLDENQYVDGVSPIKQSTLPTRGHRKRTLSNRDDYSKNKGRHKSGRSPRKRHKSSSGSHCNISPVRVEEEVVSLEYEAYSCLEPLDEPFRRRLSSTPENSQQELIEIHNLSSIGPAHSCEEYSFHGNTPEKKSQQHLTFNASRHSVLPSFDPTSKLDTNHCSSIPDDVDGVTGIFDVTANFQHNTSLVPSNATESLSNIHSVKEQKVLEHSGSYISASDEDDDDDDDSQSLHGSLTSVTCPEDGGLSPLSDCNKEPTEQAALKETFPVISPEITAEEKNRVNPTGDNLQGANRDTFTAQSSEEDIDVFDEDSAEPCVDEKETDVEKIDAETFSIPENCNPPSPVDDHRKGLDKSATEEGSVKLYKSISINGLPVVETHRPDQCPCCEAIQLYTANFSPIGVTSQPCVCHVGSESLCGEWPSSIHKVIKKKGQKKVPINNAQTGVEVKQTADDDGISFQSLDRHSILNFSEQGSNKYRVADSKSDPVLHWKPSDHPNLNPLTMDDSDSLINLSNLELIARHWRNCAFHKQVHRGYTKKVNSGHIDGDLTPAVEASSMPAS